jgi:putative membrane protein
MMGWSGGGWGMYGGLPMLLWWGLVIVAIVLVVRWLFARGTTGGPPAQDSALTILRERYARGEISKEEFDARRRDLE